MVILMICERSRTWIKAMKKNLKDTGTEAVQNGVSVMLFVGVDERTGDWNRKSCEKRKVESGHDDKGLILEVEATNVTVDWKDSLVEGYLK
jgi:hypothetical protein